MFDQCKKISCKRSFKRIGKDGGDTSGNARLKVDTAWRISSLSLYVFIGCVKTKNPRKKWPARKEISKHAQPFVHLFSLNKLNKTALVNLERNWTVNMECLTKPNRVKKCYKWIGFFQTFFGCAIFSFAENNSATYNKKSSALFHKSWHVLWIFYRNMLIYMLSRWKLCFLLFVSLWHWNRGFFGVSM
jgi:hypothetical protein